MSCNTNLWKRNNDSANTGHGFLLGGVSSVICTTCVPVAVRNESTCEPSIISVPGDHLHHRKQSVN